MLTYPTQKLDSSKKDEQWAKDSIDYTINEGHNTLRTDVVRMLNNYRMINSQMEDDDFRSICKLLGVNERVGKKYVSMYNKAPNILSTLKGEELDRPFAFSVASLIDQPNNKYVREQETKFVEHVDKIFQIEAEKMNDIVKYSVQARAKNIPEQEKEEKIQQIEEYYRQKYSKIYDMDFQDSMYKDLHTEKEKTISKLLKISFNKINLKWIKNECFSDAAIAGKEFAEITFESGNPLPIIRQLNPLNVFYHKSPDSPFTHDSDYAGYQEQMTLGQALDKYGHLLSKKQSKRLQTYSYDANGAYGTSDSLFHTRADRHASSWQAKKDAGMFPSGANIDPHARMMLDGKYQAIPTSSYSNGNNIYGPGLYADTRSYNARYVTVYTVYWKSYRKVYEYTFTNEYGKLSSEIVSEDFVIPDNYKTEKYKPSPFAETKSKKIWYDDEGNYNAVEEIWIPEIWKGIRINGDIYVDLGPLEHAYQSLLNPYKSKIPIFGFIYNSRNSAILSIADRIQPWQKLYYSVMAKLVKSLAQDKGVLTFLNTLMINDEIGFSKTIAMAEDGNIIPYNPLAYTKGNASLNNTMKAAERIDATNSDIVQYYIQILEFIEGQMVEAVGMSPQRLAKTKTNTTATDNRRETMHSMNITEPLFYAHDMLWEIICQSYMEMLLSSVSEAEGKLRGFLDDKEIAVVDLGLIHLEDEYAFKMSNNIKNSRIMEVIQSQSQALIQNDKANFSTLITLLKAEDLSELEEQILEFEKHLEEREDKAQENREKHEKELRQMEIDNREDVQIQELQKQYIDNLMRRATDIEKEHIRGKYMVTSYNLQNDADQNGIPDLMEADLEYKRFINEVAEKEQKIAKEVEDLELEKLRLKQDYEKHLNELSLKKQELRQKAQEAKMKAKEKTKN